MENLSEYYEENRTAILYKIHKIVAYYTSQVSSYKPIYKEINTMYDSINYGEVDLNTKTDSTLFIKQIDEFSNSF